MRVENRAVFDPQLRNPGLRALGARHAPGHFGRFRPKRRCKQNANGVCNGGKRNFRKAVSLLFFWSQRGDLNPGPTDYELTSNAVFT